MLFMIFDESNGLVPRSIRTSIERVYVLVLDHRWLRRLGRGVRAGAIMAQSHVGLGAELSASGDEVLSLYVSLSDLKAGDFLEPGYGIGQHVPPIVDFLNECASSDGLDLVKSAVDWCTEKYTSKYPNFRFHLINILNEPHRSELKDQLAKPRLPFDGGQFDFVAVNSVFTHMLAEDVENYLREVARVIKPGGRCLSSFFLINDESLRLIEEGRSTLNLHYKMGRARVMAERRPELAIGLDEDYVFNLYERCGFSIDRPVAYGSWCGRKEFSSYQDQIVTIKL